MKRDKRKVLLILGLIESQGVLHGLPVHAIRKEIEELEFSFEKSDQYQIYLLTQGGYITESTASGTAFIQLTWKGHDLLEVLRNEVETNS